MKFFLLLVGLIGTSAQALGQAGTGQAVTPSAVTFEELEGFIIEANQSIAWRLFASSMPRMDCPGMRRELPVSTVWLVR